MARSKHQLRSGASTRNARGQSEAMHGLVASRAARAIVALLVVSTCGAPAVASAVERESDDANAAIEAIRNVVPESLEVVVSEEGVVVHDAEAGDQDRHGRAIVDDPLVDPTDPRSDIRIDIPKDPYDGITLSQDEAADIVIGLPNGGRADEAAYSAVGVATYDNNDGSTTVPIVRPDGAVQITTVIDGPEAPTRYEYPLSVPEGGSLVDAGEGYYAVLGSDALPVAMIEPAWALDTNGEAVNTRYEVAGNSLIQIVEHKEGDAYPVVADPAVKGQYIAKVTSTRTSLGYVIGVYPVNAWSLAPGISGYWAEYKLYVGVQFETNKFYDQLRCHWDFAPFKTPWNLDSWRPDVSYTATVLAGCNP